ncbi:MAG: TatD DNase family protein [Alphaproteobacteria bacterium]|nr:MAG: TatD DNase family protein [Alphaproteobacteria bacterium]
MLIDSHVNLHAEAFDADRAAVVARAREAGVGPMLTICDRIENFSRVIGVAETFPDIWASVGAHPHYAKDHLGLTPAALVAMAGNPKVIGIGETGLDQYYRHSSLEDQTTVLRAHIAAARELDLPLIVHTRDADEATAVILEEEFKRGPFRILMHCYTSGEGLAKRALDLGAYFSLSGILTFKSANDVRAVASVLPLDRIILETDEPAFLADVHRYFCTWKGLDEEEGARLIAANFFRLFSRARPPQ